VKRRPPPPPKQWIPVTTSDGRHQGLYEVSNGRLTVQFGGGQRAARASSTGVPASMGAAADEALAKVLLGELIRELGLER
jgi:hypothetical protein